MIDDHEGQRVSRRRMFAGVGSIGLGTLVAACGSPSAATVTTSTGETAPVQPQAAGADLDELFTEANTCTLTPDTTQGPYYFDADKIRSDVREDRQGVRLRLAIKLQDSERCAALPNAVVEIWHCDAAGLYSGAEDQSAGSGGGNPPPGPPPDGGQPDGGQPGGGDQDLVPTDDKRYLRGAQVTNADGIVVFTTIWPGWYLGRTVHVHVMVHVSNERVLTSQLMFDEALNSAVFAQEPYAAHTGRDTFNDGDGIYEPSMLLKVVEDGDGYLGSIVLAADSDQDGA